MLFQESWWDPAGIFIKEHILAQCMREHQKGQMRGLLECTGWACGVGGSSEHPVNELVKLVVGWSAYKHDAKRGSLLVQGEGEMMYDLQSALKSKLL